MSKRPAVPNKVAASIVTNASDWTEACSLIVIACLHPKVRITVRYTELAPRRLQAPISRLEPTHEGIGLPNGHLRDQMTKLLGRRCAAILSLRCPRHRFVLAGQERRDALRGHAAVCSFRTRR